MEREPLIRLTWHGPRTVEAIPPLLIEAAQIEITLPVNYNHALFRALNPDADEAAVEQIDARAGPELLNDIATVGGLEALAELSAPLRAARASVELSTPPTLVIKLPATSTQPA